MSYNYALRPGTHQMITLANGNSTPSAAFGTQTEYVRICSDADVHIIFGAAPVATANSIFISAEEFEIFKESLIESNHVKNKTLFLPIHPNYKYKFIENIINKVNSFKDEI